MSKPESRPESREVSRRQCSCILSAVYEGDSKAIPLRPPDLSAGGMFISTAQFLPADSVLKLRLLLSGREFLLRAEVRHCLPGQGVGVEFVNPSPEALLAIEEEMKNHPSAACIFFPPTSNEK
jgi:PilZ domain-containing protein